MPGVQFDGGRVHPLREEALKLRVDRAVLPGYGVPRWLGPPRRGGRLLARESNDVGGLCRVQPARRSRLDSVGEVVHERRFAQLSEPIRDDDTGTGRWRGESLRQSGEVLTGVRCARRYVDQRGDVGITANLADDSARPGVA